MTAWSFAIRLAVGQCDEAVACFRRTLALKPDYAEAHYNLGNALHALGQHPAALIAYRQALALWPWFPLAHNNLGILLKELGQVDDALACYRRALELEPGYCEAQGNLLFALNSTPGHYVDRLEQARQYGRMAAWKAHTRYTSWRCADAPERLRVGLVSGDLRNHPVGYFLEGVLAQLDPARLELIAYPTVREADELSARIRARCAHWKPIHDLNDAAAAQLIHDDDVHILLDLSGPNRHSDNEVIHLLILA